MQCDGNEMCLPVIDATVSQMINNMIQTGQTQTAVNGVNVVNGLATGQVTMLKHVFKF